MTLQTALAAAATLVSLAFSLSTFERWLARRRPQELAWSLALAMFTAGSAALWFGAAMGWSGPAFRIFYLFGAVVDVPFLALGTVYLLGGRRAGDRSAAVVGLASAFAAGVVLVAPLRRPIPRHRLPKGSDVFGALPRVLAAVASGVGALVVLGGAVWSAWRLARARAALQSGEARARAALQSGEARARAAEPSGEIPRSAAPPAALVGANALIAGGTLVLAAGGLFNSVLGEMEAFAVTLVMGISLMFAGFLMATGAGPRAAEVPDTPGRGSVPERVAD